MKKLTEENLYSRVKCLSLWLACLACFLGVVKGQECKSVKQMEDVDFGKITGLWSEYAATPSGGLRFADCVHHNIGQYLPPILPIATEVAFIKTQYVLERIWFINFDNEAKILPNKESVLLQYLVDTDYDNFLFIYECDRQYLRIYDKTITLENYLFLTREQFPSDDVVDSMKKSLNNIGVEWNQIEVLNHTGCPELGQRIPNFIGIPIFAIW